MFSKIRSLIFKLDPELTHALAIKALKFNYNPTKNIKKDSSIETIVFGKKIFNPIGIAAGFTCKCSRSLLPYRFLVQSAHRRELPCRFQEGRPSSTCPSPHPDWHRQKRA